MCKPLILTQLRFSAKKCMVTHYHSCSVRFGSDPPQDLFSTFEKHLCSAVHAVLLC